MTKEEEMKNEEIPGDQNAVDTSQESVVSPLKKRLRQSVESSVDLYAVQCAQCHKWRVVGTQEEFEDIRSKIFQDPFFCSRKNRVTCEDPADINYDATRTWVIDKPNLPKPPQGFKRSLVLRKDYSKMDVYYISPLGKKLRTRNEVAEYIKANPEHADISPSSFFFATPKIMESTIPSDLFVKRSPPGPNRSSKRKSKTSPASPQSQSHNNHLHSSPSNS